MKMIMTSLAAVGLVVLAGCSSDASDDHSAQACDDFAKSHRELTNSLRDGKLNLSIQEVDAKRSAAVDSMDTAGLSTSNTDIKDRVTALVDATPTDTKDLLLSKSEAEEFNKNTESVARACESAGTAITVNKIAIVKYMGP